MKNGEILIIDIILKYEKLVILGEIIESNVDDGFLLN